MNQEKLNMDKIKKLKTKNGRLFKSYIDLKYNNIIENIDYITDDDVIYINNQDILTKQYLDNGMSLIFSKSYNVKIYCFSNKSNVIGPS